MNIFRLITAIALCATIFYGSFQVKATPDAGFFMPDELNEITLRYKSYHNLIVLPVTINDTLQVNLILDTGCRNLVLFGKRFQNILVIDSEKKIQFSGLGSGQPIIGALSLNNTISMERITGLKIPIVIVPERNLFERSHAIDGVIGYDIFIKFEVELNPKEKQITFRPASSITLPNTYQHIPIRIEDSRPILKSHISIGQEIFPCNLMIDTGSSLGLLMKTNDEEQLKEYDHSEDLGRGLNGIISGFNTKADRLELDGFSFKAMPIGIIRSPWHNYASIGMEVLKGYSIVLNYCKEYIGFKKNS